jgi:BlaI family penicillinase repressor
MEENPRISDAEWEVMKVIWDNPNCTAGFVIEALKDFRDWKPKTIKSLIKRLTDKGILSFEPDGREYRYYPLISEKECVKSERDSFLQRVYRGSKKAMLLNFIDENELSNEDIEELKRILDERK